MKKYVLLLSLLLTAVLFGNSQSFDLQKLVKKNKLVPFGMKPTPITEGGKQGITISGIVWLKDVNFSNGTIEVDLRGRDVLQRSFIGIAFHGVDTTTYDAIYFRPFNFQSKDSIRRIHAVQYIALPDFTWRRLREERNGIYEKAVTPAPAATEWFHTRIVIEETEIKVYVNNSETASLTVSKLNTRKDGLIGIWTDKSSLPGDFANLVIKK